MTRFNNTPDNTFARAIERTPPSDGDDALVRFRAPPREGRLGPLPLMLRVVADDGQHWALSYAHLISIEFKSPVLRITFLRQTVVIIGDGLHLSGLLNDLVSQRLEIVDPSSVDLGGGGTAITAVEVIDET